MRAHGKCMAGGSQAVFKLGVFWAVSASAEHPIPCTSTCPPLEEPHPLLLCTAGSLLCHTTTPSWESSSSSTACLPPEPSSAQQHTNSQRVKPEQLNGPYMVGMWKMWSFTERKIRCNESHPDPQNDSWCGYVRQQARTPLQSSCSSTTLGWGMNQMLCLHGDRMLRHQELCLQTAPNKVPPNKTPRVGSAWEQSHKSHGLWRTLAGGKKPFHHFRWAFCDLDMWHGHLPSLQARTSMGPVTHVESCTLGFTVYLSFAELNCCLVPEELLSLPYRSYFCSNWQMLQTIHKLAANSRFLFSADLWSTTDPLVGKLQLLPQHSHGAEAQPTAGCQGGQGRHLAALCPDTRLTTAKAKGSPRDHNHLPPYETASPMLISFLPGNGAAICCSYLQLKCPSISLFSCFRNSTVFCGLLHLINPMLPSVCSWQIPFRNTSLQGLWNPQHVWMDVTYLSWSVPQAPWWLSLNRWVFSWYKSAELSWDSFISTKNTAQNIEFISHASDCQTASLAERTIISKRNARNSWKILLELDFWQPEAGADAPHQPLSVPWAHWQGQELLYPPESFLWLLQRTEQPNQKAAGDKPRIIENLGDNFP